MDLLGSVSDADRSPDRGRRLQDGDRHRDVGHLLIPLSPLLFSKTPLLVDVLVHGDLFAEKVGEQTDGRERDGDEPDESERDDKGVDDFGLHGFGQGVQDRDGGVGAEDGGLVNISHGMGRLIEGLLTYRVQNRTERQTRQAASS